MITILLYLLGLNLIQSDSALKSEQLKSLDKIFASQNFTIIQYACGDWSCETGKFEIYKESSTWEMEYRRHIGGFGLPKKEEYEFIYKIELIPDNISTLKKVLTVGITRPKSQPRCAGCWTTYTISREDSKIEFEGNGFDDFQNWKNSIDRCEVPKWVYDSVTYLRRNRHTEIEVVKSFYGRQCVYEFNDIGQHPDAMSVVYDENRKII